MMVSLPGITEIEYVLMDAYQSLSKHKIVFSKDAKRETWVSNAQKATADVWKKISLQENIYFIFGQDEELLDVGKASSKNRDIRKRLKEHIVYCSNGTSSMLELLKNYICDEQHTTIYLATLRIEPEEYYQMAESFYILNCNPAWNSRID